MLRNSVAVAQKKAHDDSLTGLLRTLTIPSALWEPQYSPKAAPGQLKLERLVHPPAAHCRLVRPGAAASGCGAAGSARCAAASSAASRSSDRCSAALLPSMLPDIPLLLASLLPLGKHFRRILQRRNLGQGLADQVVIAACLWRCAGSLV